MDSLSEIQTLLESISMAARRLAECDRWTYTDGIEAGMGNTAAVIRYSNGAVVAVRVERIDD